SGRSPSAGSAAVADVLGSTLCAGLREQGRPEFQLHQCLLRHEGRRFQGEGRRLQGRQGGWRQEEKSLSIFALKTNGPLLAAARSSFGIPRLITSCAAESATARRSPPGSAACPETSTAPHRGWLRRDRRTCQSASFLSAEIFPWTLSAGRPADSSSLSTSRAPGDRNTSNRRPRGRPP